MELVRITPDEFESFARFHPQSTFVQSKAMAQVQQAIHTHNDIFALKKGDEIVAAGLFKYAPALSKFKIAYGTPLLDYSNPTLTQVFFSELKKEFKKLKVIYAEITPNFARISRNEAGEITDEFNHQDWIDNIVSAGLSDVKLEPESIEMFEKWRFVKDFSMISDDQSLLKSLNQVSRTKINKTRKAAIEVIETNDDLSEFLKVMAHTSERREFHLRDTSYFEALVKYFGKDIKVLMAVIDFEKEYELIVDQQKSVQGQIDQINQQIPLSRKNENKLKEFDFQLTALKKRLEELNQFKPLKKEVVSAAMFIHYGHQITYTYSGSYDRYLAFDATYALQDQAFKWGIKEGIQQFDFYGTTGSYSGHEDTGVYFFKKSFGGHVTERAGLFKLVVSPVLDKAYALSQKIIK